MEAGGRDGAVDVVGEVAVLRAALPSVAYRVAGRARTFAPGALDGPPEGPWTAADGAVRLTLSTRPVGVPGPPGGVLVRLAVTVIGDAEVLLDRATLVSLGGPGGLRLGDGPSRWSLLRNGWGSWADARSFRMDEADGDPWLFAVRDVVLDQETPRPRVPGRFRSELVAGLVDLATGAALVLGFVGGARCTSVVDLAVTAVDGAPPRTGSPPARLAHLAASCGFDGIPVAPGATVATEDLLVADGDDGHRLLEGWAAALGAAQGARVPSRPPHGWCSWYHHGPRVTETDVRRAVAAADGPAADVPVGYVMVDDGHQSAIGDWTTTGPRFPSGMADLAAHITASGRDAGIWLAPFLVDPDSVAARHHPSWLLRDAAGDPVRALWNPGWNRRRAQWVLDCTRPEVLDHLTEVAATLHHGWGYRVLKLDFCFAAALPGRRHDRTRTRPQALRAGLEAIRRGAGDDALLIGCGVPLGPAVGVCDAVRVGTDVAPRWGGRVQRWATGDQGGRTARLAARNAVTRAFLHGHLWANDPDCLLVRRDRSRLTDAEVRLLVAVAALTDGMLVSGDRLDLVPPDRLDLLRLAHELSGGRPRVADLFDRAEPTTVVTTRPEEVLWGHLHWGDRPRRVRVELSGPEWDRLGLPAPREVAEALTGARLPVVDRRVDLGVLPPHDARILRLPRARRAADRGPSP